MGILQVISMLAALAVTLGLFGLAVWVWRRFAPATLLPNAAPRERRMKVIETLVMGTNHRLVLVRLDGEERLVLLGEGSLIGAAHAPRDLAKDAA
ncbi:MAG TPA: flagellar biosynthetic protein FliO [Caulobacteraceae bacterium]|jgi:flagellar protein FliO/FliZ